MERTEEQPPPSFYYRKVWRCVWRGGQNRLILQAKFIASKMDIENKREWRFYTCLLMGFSLLVGGFYSPPLGEIPDSVIISAGILLCLGALCVGVDLKGIIRELRLLKTETINEHDKD